MASAIALWKADIRAALMDVKAVFQERYGYPPGENSATDPEVSGEEQTDNVAIPSSLVAFYLDVGELSIPDVHNGYFIHTLELVKRGNWGHPKRIEVEIDGQALNEDILTFGSNGGGHLFCINRSNGAIYELPHGEINEHNVYLGGLCNPKLVASSFEEFLHRLLSMTKDFAVGGSASL